MRICHVVAELDPDLGGPPVVALELARAQAQLGHEVAVLGHYRAGREDIATRFLQPFEKHGIRPMKVAASRIERVIAGRGLVALKRWLKEGGGGVLHLHGFWEPLLLRAANHCANHAVPYVLAPHGMLYPYCLNQKRTKKRVSLWITHRKLLDRAALVHVLNRDEADAVQALRPVPPIKIFANGVDQTVIQSVTSGRFRMQLARLEQRPYILFVGRLHPIKGLDVLISAYQKYRSQGGTHDLVLVGPDAGVESALRQQIRREGLESWVHFTGALYEQQKLEAFRDASAYVQCSRHETFSMSITEALSFGLPAVITDSSHFPEVEQYGAGRVVPLDASSVARALFEITNQSEALRQQMSANAMLFCREHCHWPVIASALLQEYTRLLRD